MEPMGENKAKGILGSGKLGPLLPISCFPRNFMYDRFGGRCGQGLIDRPLPPLRLSAPSVHLVEFSWSLMFHEIEPSQE